MIISPEVPLELEQPGDDFLIDRNRDFIRKGVLERRCKGGRVFNCKITYLSRNYEDFLSFIINHRDEEIEYEHEALKAVQKFAHYGVIDNNLENDMVVQLLEIEQKFPNALFKRHLEIILNERYEWKILKLDRVMKLAKRFNLRMLEGKMFGVMLQ